MSLRPSVPITYVSQLSRRHYALSAPGVGLQVFNNRHKWLQKERAAQNVDSSRNVDYLRDEIASRLCERLLDINRHFPQVLDLGANACNIARALTKPPSDTGCDVSNSPDTPALTSRIGKLVAADTHPTFLNRDADLPFNKDIEIDRQILDSNEHIPFESNTFDAVLSSLSMHWINDLPSVLRQINDVLKPDAPLIAAMLGGDSLFELRTSLQLAELDRRGGVSTRVSPLADVRDVGGLLQSAGFKLLTVDVDDIVVDYPDSFALMQDLQAMGESNAVINREQGPIARDTLVAGEAIYKELHGNEDGSVPATFRVIYLIGWKESPNQQKPEPRGSGQVDLSDVLGGSGGKFGPGHS